MFAPGHIHINKTLFHIFFVDHVSQFRICGGYSSGTSPAAFAISASDTFNCHKISRSDDTSVCTKGDSLCHIKGVPDAAAGDQTDLVSCPFFHKESVNFWNGIFNGHGNILFGNVRGCTRTAVTAVNVNDMGTGMIGAYGNHVHIRGGGYFYGAQDIMVNFLHPVHMLFMVFNRIDGVEREG